jgi:RND family efflux transporter MFP subunit
MRAPARLLLHLALAGAFASCVRAADSAALPVRTARVTATTVALTQPLAATVHPLERATVAARVAGAVTGASFAVGQSVQSGELVLTLDAAEFSARAQQARAALAQADRELARETALLEKNATPGDAVLAAKDRQRIAQAAVAEADAILAHTRVTAPFTGVITRKFVNTGDIATAGTPLFALEATDHLRAELSVPESLAALPPGAVVAVQLAPDITPVSARLAEFSAAADPVTRTRLAKLDLPPDTPARSGQFARALWPTGNATALVVPLSALSVFGQIERVYVVTTDHRAQLRLVKSGARSGATVEILAGLDAGETVILAPAATLRDGQPVAVTP